MPYNSQIARTDVAALIPEDVASDILTLLPKQSAALTLFRQVRMSTKQRRMPVLSALPLAYFVDGDTGLKQTTDVAWANKYLNAEELAVIVPIPDAVLDDSSFDVWGNIQPLMAEALGRAIDNAVFFGVNKPALWDTDIATGVLMGGGTDHTVVRGTTSAANGGLAVDMSNLFGLVELGGFDVNGVIARTTYRSILRNARDGQGNRLDDITANTIHGVNVEYPLRGMWPTAASSIEAFVGDFSQGIMGLRQDITYKLLDQAVITDNTGAIVYNLAQQDMVAMRVVIRVGYAVANPISHDEPTEANRYPFAAMLSPGA